MTSFPIDWIAPTGLRPIDPEAVRTEVPIAELHTAGLSLTAIGLYGELLSYQGAPINPFDNQLDGVEDIRTAIEELIDNGYAVRTPAPNPAD